MKRASAAAPLDTIEQTSDMPPWRADAVQLLFASYWDELADARSDPAGAAAARPENVAARRAYEWENVFARLGACGVWEELFPTEERSDSDHVFEIAERFLESRLMLAEVRRDGRRARRVAREIRKQVDALMIES